jgi:hypothetical protein
MNPRIRDALREAGAEAGRKARHNAGPEHKLAAKHVLTLGYRSRSRITAPSSEWRSC